MQQIFAVVFAPLAWLMGVSWKDAPTIGNLLGTRLVLNEFVAFLQLGPLKIAARSALVHHRHLRAVRLRQFQLDRHSDRRHRRAGAQPQIRPGAAGVEGRGRGQHGQFHVGLHCGDAAVIAERRRSVSGIAHALRPRVAVVLGSGLGAFADELSDRTEIPYAEIPGWPCSTAIGHAGKLVFGKLGTLDVAVMAGRVHLYEGYTPAQVTFGVRVLGSLGVRSIVFTNAAGGINLALERGGLVLISDHINLQGSNPLVGPNDDSLGRGFRICRKRIRAACARWRTRWQRDSASAWRRAFTRPCWDRATRPPPRSATCGPSAPIWWGCLPCRSDRGQSHGHARAGHLLRDEYGRRHPAAKDRAMRRCWRPARWCAAQWK
jgi:hypothetical protein